MFSKRLGFLLLFMAVLLGGLFALRLSQLRYRPADESRVDTRSVLSSELLADGQRYTLSYDQHRRLIAQLARMQEAGEPTQSAAGLESITLFRHEAAPISYSVLGRDEAGLLIALPDGRHARVELFELLMEAKDA